MEQTINSKSIKIILVSLGSLALLLGLLLIANQVRTPVVFSDPNLELVIREKIEKRSGTIFRSDLLTITELDASSREIRQLGGLESLNRLVTLNLADNQVEDLTPLANLQMLRSLNLSGNQVNDLDSVSFGELLHLPLRELYIENDPRMSGGIEDLSLFSSLTELEIVTLGNNQVQDISPLSNLSNLQELDLKGNKVADCEPIRSLTSLRVLSLQGYSDPEASRLENFSCLEELVNLEVLDLRHNRIHDLQILANLTNLRELDLRDNQLTDIEAISGLTGLIRLNLRDNLIGDLQPVSGLTNLTYLNIHSNPIETGIDAVGNLTQLETLIMRNVWIGDNHAFLGELSLLSRLNIRNTGIKDLSVIGDLMAAGTLQDDPETGLIASIDLLEIAPSDAVGDPYENLRRYWDHIRYRYPLNLPFYPSSVKPPLFSHQSGFYENEFVLEITTDEPFGKIFYTLDGSEPAFTADFQPVGATTLYTEPLQIINRAHQPNELSNITTGYWILQHFPPSEVFKGTVIRSVVINEAGDRSNIHTLSYFVDDRMTEHYSMPVISIVSNPDYFFDDRLGIYVPGDLYIPPLTDQHWTEDQANFFQRGLKWERPITFQMFTANGETIIDLDAGIRIHGSYTRGFNQKSLRLYARDVYNSQDLIQFDLFPALNGRVNQHVVNTFETLIIRNGGNDWSRAIFRDILAHSLLEDTRLDIQGYQPVIVFINGEYWGIHNIRTRYDRHYFRTYYNLTDEDMLVFEVEGADPFVYIGEAGDESFYIDLLKIIDPDYIDNDYKTVSTLSNEQAYESLSDQIDIENFITYNASQIYFNNTDWPHNNVRFWRKKNPTSYTTEDLPYGHDGKWRWMVLDIDRALRGDVEQNMLIHATEDELSATYLFRSLLENSTFQQLFINHFADLLNTNFREDVVIERINQLEDQYLPEVADQIHRWGQPDVNVNQWLRTVDQIREFANQRPAIQREHLMAYFNLPGIATVVLQTDPSMGFVKINSIDILENNTGIENPSSWSGVYFQGVPIQLTAVPQPGFRFSHWEGVPGNSVDFTSETIILELFDDLDIHAVFSPEEP